MFNNDIKNIMIHLRLPFSVFLMPVFWFALYQSPQPDTRAILVLFGILHVLLYPSSNGYNSYMDNDTESIGGIKHPPKVPKAMFWVSVSMDILAAFLSFYYFHGGILALILVYIGASRAYSYRGIRLKKYPIIGFLTVAIVQGCVVFSIVAWSLNPLLTLNFTYFLSLFISFLLIGAGYPLTQIYQHKQDAADGVKTLSLRLGIRGTFIFSGLLFALLGASLCLFFVEYGRGISDILMLTLCLSPVAFYFINWQIKTFKDEKNANFEHTMQMNTIGSVSLNLFFLLLLCAPYFL